MLTIDFNRLNIKPGNRILDIGCGEGRHTAKAWEFPGTVCIGADMSHKDLLVSAEKLKFHEAFLKEINASASPSRQNDSTWALSASDITNLPFSDNAFDIVICSEVMEHIHDEIQALNEIKRVLKPGGILALSVPRYWPEKICWLLSKEYSNTKGGHIRIYRQKRLKNLIISVGFEQVGEHHFSHALHMPYWWLKCLMGLNRKDSKAVTLYHELLVWDLLKQPAITRLSDKLLNPIMGKSIVLYFQIHKS